MTQSKLADLCDVSPQAVSNWVNGIARPSPEAMLIIEKHLGITMREWVENPRRTGTEG